MPTSATPAQVPPQQFASSPVNPPVANSQNNWLDALPDAPVSPAAYNMPYAIPAATPPPQNYSGPNHSSPNSGASSPPSAADMYLAHAESQLTRDTYVERGQSWSVDWAKVGGGILAMVGAVVWFVLGLMADRIFFYPPIMFILGLIAVVNGLFSGD